MPRWAASRSESAWAYAPAPGRVAAKPGPADRRAGEGTERGSARKLRTIGPASDPPALMLTFRGYGSRFPGNSPHNCPVGRPLPCRSGAAPLRGPLPDSARMEPPDELDGAQG